MTNLIEAQKEIKQLCINRYHSPDDFILFTKKLIDLGVVRQAYDVVKNDLYFYSNDALLYHLPIQEIHNAIDAKSFEIGNCLDKEMIKATIEAFDANKLSVVEFHQQIAQAGVIYVTVYLPQQKIYYMGQDAQYYLESYANA